MRRSKLLAAVVGLQMVAWVLGGSMLGGCSVDPARQMTETREAQRLNLAHDTVGTVPRGFTTALTGGGGEVLWAVRNDAGQGKVVIQESADDTSYRFPLCIYDSFSAADVSAEIRFKAISGTVDQAAGVLVRYTRENYYVARANSLEDNVNLFRVVNGKRDKLVEVPATIPLGTWHQLRLIAVGPRLRVYLDGKLIIEHEDKVIAGPGKVGLWTKADSVTAFSSLEATKMR